MMWGLGLSAVLSSTVWLLVTKVSGQPVSPILKGKAIQGDLDCMTHEDGCDRLSQNIGN